MIPTEAGDYTVTTGMSDDGPVTYDFVNVLFEYGDDGLRVLRGGSRELVAHFRWWDSIVASDTG